MRPIVHVEVSRHAIDRYKQRVDSRASHRAAVTAIRDMMPHTEPLTGPEWARQVREGDKTDPDTEHRIYRPGNLVIVLAMKGSTAVVMTVFKLRGVETTRNTAKRAKLKDRGFDKCKARRRELQALKARELDADA